MYMNEKSVYSYKTSKLIISNACTLYKSQVYEWKTNVLIT